jgi:hypothetical protein
LQQGATPRRTQRAFGECLQLPYLAPGAEAAASGGSFGRCT